MDWLSFFLGYSVGTAQMLCVDAVILYIVWPVRGFIAILRRPLTKIKIKIMLGEELTLEEEGILKLESLRRK